MADPKNNPDEPSIEEILSSIREIISDEDEDESIETQDFASVEKEEFAVRNVDQPAELTYQVGFNPLKKLIKGDLL
mgnify:CR=1 FL=1